MISRVKKDSAIVLKVFSPVSGFVGGRFWMVKANSLEIFDLAEGYRIHEPQHEAPENYMATGVKNMPTQAGTTGSRVDFSFYQ